MFCRNFACVEFQEFFGVKFCLKKFCLSKLFDIFHVWVTKKLPLVCGIHNLAQTQCATMHQKVNQQKSTDLPRSYSYGAKHDTYNHRPFQLMQVNLCIHVPFSHANFHGSLFLQQHFFYIFFLQQQQKLCVV